LAFAVTHPSVEYSSGGANIVGSAIDASLSMLAASGRPIISFAMGSPAPEAIPTESITRAIADILSGGRPASAFDYSPTEGDPRLRRALIEWVRDEEGEIDPDCLLVTAGGMQGLDLVTKLFVSPGDLVLAESPSYANGLATLHNYGATVAQVPMDDQGMDLGAACRVVAEAGRLPRLIYAIPTFQNPSGVTYSLDRREKLLTLAREWGALILEDDPYSQLRYEGDPLPTLLTLDAGGGFVVQVRTFSKIVAPGLRLGWLVAPADTVARMAAAKQSMDTCANTLSQQVVARLIETGDLDRHVTALRALYPRRRDRMLAALERHFPREVGVQWSRPVGGMFVWIELPPPVDGATLLEAALEEGVAAVPGEAFDHERGRGAIRACFTGAAAEDIDEGVRRLGRALATTVGGGG
jgi:2-aminoadipate transaminase